MSITYIQSQAQSQVSSVTFSGPTTAGNTIVVGIADFNNGGSEPAYAVTDSQGNVYTAVAPAQQGANAGNRSQVFVARNIIGGANTVSYTPGFGTVRILIAAEYTGASRTAPVRDADSSYSSGAGTKSVTLTTKISDLVVLFTVEMIPADTTPPVGFTLRDGAGNPLGMNLYDGPASGTGTNPYPVTTTDASGGTLWGVVLGNNLARCYIFEM
jgi:hypothetical protein